MHAAEFRHLVSTVAHGKRLPDAIYIVRPAQGDLHPSLLSEIHRAETAAQPSPDWNLLKLHAKEFALTFLSYPEFDNEPHPVLAEATKINLNTGSVVRTDYRQRANPPILHRKETFLAPGDPRCSTFAALTQQEERAQLYRDPSRIGLRLHWQSLLKKSKLAYEDHRLVPVCEVADQQLPTGTESAEVLRHRTAIKRYDLSKPVKLLLERGLLSKNDTFFDYGCGHGMDIEALQGLGYRADGWDPAFRPNVTKTHASVINLGYVLNVIESPSERVSALRDAFALADRLLIVSTLVAGQETASHSRPYGDGFLTKTNTFQKFYAPGELETLIEDTLSVQVSTLGIGVCVAFRHPEEAETFEASRNRRKIDWAEISAQLRFSSSVTRDQRNVSRYELHKELFDGFWNAILELGRPPEPGEFDRLSEVRKAAGGLNKAVALVIAQNGAAVWEHVRKTRSEDVIVYLAMTNFRRRFLRREIPARIKHDIQSFFGDLKTAQEKARDLLYAAGDPDEIELACDGLDIGWQDEGALYIHRDLLGKLPAILRLYVACAALRYGDPEAADIIKLHKRTRKVTFQHYDDFEEKPLPELQTRIKVNLRNRFVDVFDHTTGPTQLLYFKERFVAKAHPRRAEFESFSQKLRRLGFDESTIGFGPDKSSFTRQLDAANLNENLNPRRSRHSIT